MIFLLDTMVVSYFLQASREGELAAAARRCPMAITEDVREELRKDRNRGGRAFDKWLAASNIAVRLIVVGSPAHATLVQLPGCASPERGRGERASIAVAASDASLALVTHDRNALWIALRELWMPGQHVLGLAVFLRRLFEDTALASPEVLDEIMSLAGAPALPTWWASWRAAITSSSLSSVPFVSAAPAASPGVAQPDAVGAAPAPSADGVRNNEEQ